MEANTGRRVQLDREFGADSAARGLVAPEDPDVGADGRGDVSKPRPPPPPPVLLLLQTCYYQRKDSPVEALTLSPEPLWGERGERKGEQGAGKGKQGGRTET